MVLSTGVQAHQMPAVSTGSSSSGSPGSRRRGLVLPGLPGASVNERKSSYFSVFEEPEDPSSRSFFSEIISSISDVKFSHSGRYMMTRDYLSVKVWDLNMESRPVETHQVRQRPWGAPPLPRAAR